MAALADLLASQAPADPLPWNIALRELPPPAALRLLQRMRQEGVPPDSYTATTVVALYRSAGLGRHVGATLAAMHDRQGLQPSTHVLLAWAALHADERDPRGVRAVMNDARRRGLALTPHFYTLLLRAYCQAGWCAAAACRRVLPPPLQPQRRVWLKGAGREATEQRWGWPAASPCRWWPAASQRLGSVGPKTWRSAALCKASEGAHVLSHQQSCPAARPPACRESAAARVPLEMAAAGLPPNELTLRALMICHGQHGRPGEAARVLESMAGAGIEPREATHGALVTAYAEAGRAQEVRAARAPLARYAEPRAGSVCCCWNAPGRIGAL